MHEQEPTSRAPVHKLDETKLGETYDQAFIELQELINSNAESISKEIDRNSGETISQEVSPLPTGERVMAAARVPNYAKDYPLEYVRSGIAHKTSGKMISHIEAALPDLKIRDYGAYGMSNKDTRFGILIAEMHDDIFISDGKGRTRDDVFADPSGRILRSIDGYKSECFGDLDPTPLSEEDVDELVQLMPALLTYSEYKMAKWHGNPNALGNTVELLERLAANYPEKVLDIDLDDTTKHISVMMAGATIEARNLAKRIEAAERGQAYAEVALGLTRIKALQQIFS